MSFFCLLIQGEEKNNNKGMYEQKYIRRIYWISTKKKKKLIKCHFMEHSCFLGGF
jgi:hypothetical protein